MGKAYRHSAKLPAAAGKTDMALKDSTAVFKKDAWSGSFSRSVRVL